MQMQDVKFHEAANIFPLLDGKDFDDLVEDIRKHGLRETIKTLDGKIIDGRNRYRAALQANVDRRFDSISTDDPVAYVLSLNLHRRHMSPSQLAIVGGKARDFYDQQAKERQKEHGGTAPGKNTCGNGSTSDSGRARDQAGAAVGVSGKLVDRATKVINHAEPEVLAAVEQGRMSVTKAAEIADEPAETQKVLAAAAAFKGGRYRNTAEKDTAKQTHTLTGKSLKAATLTEKAVAMRTDIALGFSKTEVCAHYGIPSTTYKRLAQVAWRKHASLIAAVDSQLLEPGAAQALLKKTDAEIDAAIEKAQVEADMPETTRSRLGRFNSTSMQELLYRTYMEWYSIGCNVKINSHILPSKEEKLLDMQREAQNVRKYVNQVLNTLNSEIKKCLQKIHG